MYAKSLWESDELVFSSVDPSAGYYDEDMSWVEGARVDSSPIQGSLQPLDGTHARQVTTPRGVTLEGAWMFATKDGNLASADEVTLDLAPRTTIQGREYYVARKGDWTSPGNRAKHYLYILLVCPRDTKVSEL
jgi:hypothetical protein